MRKALIVVLVLLGGMFANGFFYSAHAECARSQKISIDPSLVPYPPNISREAMMGTLLDRQTCPNQTLRNSPKVEFPAGLLQRAAGGANALEPSLEIGGGFSRAA